MVELNRGSRKPKSVDAGQASCRSRSASMRARGGEWDSKQLDNALLANAVPVRTHGPMKPHEHLAGRRHDLVPLGKETNWEGAFRVPCLARWPGVIRPGTVTNEIMSHNDWIPTLCAAAGEPDIVNKLRNGYTANGIAYKVHLDRYNQTTFLRNVSGTAANNTGTKSARDKVLLLRRPHWPPVPMQPGPR
jgi:arylsulfatase A-like enzyme